VLVTVSALNGNRAFNEATVASLLIHAPLEIITTTLNALIVLAGMLYPVQLIGAMAGPLVGAEKLPIEIVPGTCAFTPKIPAIITDTSKIVQNVCVCVTTVVPLLEHHFHVKSLFFEKIMKCIDASTTGARDEGKARQICRKKRTLLKQLLSKVRFYHNRQKNDTDWYLPSLAVPFFQKPLRLLLIRLPNRQRYFSQFNFRGCIRCHLFQMNDIGSVNPQKKIGWQAGFHFLIHFMLQRYSRKKNWNTIDRSIYGGANHPLTGDKCL